MFHSNTQRLIDVWQGQRNNGAGLPERAQISPVAFGPLLPQLFMLGGPAAGDEVFRLAGGFLADLHGRDLRGAEFCTLWSKPDRHRVIYALTRARREAAPVVATADASTISGETIGLEITLAPLVGPTGEVDRIIGLYQPISMTARLVGKPISQLSLRQVDLIESNSAKPRERSHLRLVACNGLRVA